jgi:uracil-DNA glycosylase
MSVAVKCVPPGDKPTAQERNNCAKHLASEIECLPNLKIVLGLGKIGFESFLHFSRKSFDIKMKDYPFKHGVGYNLPNGIALYGAYHPSPRNVNTKTITFDMMVKFLKKLKNEI